MELKHFPKNFVPTSLQEKAISRIDKALKKYRFVVVQGPTGVGKSMLAKTIANSTSKLPKRLERIVNDYTAYQSTWDNNKLVYEYADDFSSKRFGTSILTTTKQLQDQYTRDFSDIQTLKGKGSYLCNIDERSTADVAPCLFSSKLKRECWDCNRCDYYESRNKAISAKVSIENYASFFHKPDHLKNRDVIICDEASELENVIVNRFSCSIEMGRLEKYGFQLRYSFDRKRFHNNLESLNEKLEFRSNELMRILDKHTTVSDSYKKEYKFVSDLKGHISRILNTWYDSEYLYEDVRVKNKRYIKLIPKKVDNLAKHLFKYANKVVLMSATFVDYKAFMRGLGVSDDEYTFVDLPSDFDSTKSPIYVGGFRLNNSNLVNVFPKVVNEIKLLLEKHKDEKGLIHTQSDEITRMLQDALGKGRLLYRIQGQNENADIITKHLASDKPTVLASPSMNFGVDLKGDLARFCIVVKQPWLNLKDIRVAAMNKTVKGWYDKKMLTSLIQQCGRCTRDKNDYSRTYILDGFTLTGILKRNINSLPKYFIDRFV